MKPGKCFNKTSPLFLILVLSVVFLAGCATKEPIKIPFSEPQAHPQLAKMQSLSPEVAEGVTHFGSSKRYQKNGITVVVLKGEPYELGYARGVLLKDEMVEFAGDWLSIINNKDDLERLMQRTREMKRFIPEEYREELKGLSAGSGIEYETLLMVNALNTTGRDMGCTSIAVKGSDGKLLRSRNHDYLKQYEALFKNTMLFLYQPAQGYAFASITPPGLIGVLTSMNEQGFTLGFHSIGNASTRFLNGMPIFMLSRQLAQYAGSMEDADKIVTEAVRCEPRLLMLTDSDRARIYEFDDKQIASKEMKAEPLILTMHTQVLNIGSPWPDSLTNYNDAKSFLAEHKGTINVQKLIELNRSSSISCEYNPVVANLHSAIFVPSTLDFWIAFDPPPATQGKWVGFNLSNELHGGGEVPEPAVIPAER